ncbi:MAG TPA: hypothetical protein VGV89_07135 [Thermoplasmata archaeon]|nr:hypothetical protein [Thermoplasmata archaeon]
MTVQTPPEAAQNLADDDYYGPDMPDDPAPPDAPDATGDAPYGYTTDRKTGEVRPKKAPGRPRIPPDAEQLEQGPELPRDADRPPDEGKRRRRGKGPAADFKAPPMPAGGTVAKRINRVYRKAGKFVRAFDPELGAAFIESATAEPVPEGDEPDLTVGEAWENLCRTNPRIRARVLKLLEGGAWTEVFLAHSPIGVALLMKPAVMRFLPIGKLAASWMEVDEDSLPGDLTPEDLEQLRGLADDNAATIAAKLGNVPPDVMREAARVAAQMDNGGPPVPPAAYRRQQPRNRSRARRRG